MDGLTDYMGKLAGALCAVCLLFGVLLGATGGASLGLDTIAGLVGLIVVLVCWVGRAGWLLWGGHG